MGSVICTCKLSNGQQDSNNFGQFLDQQIVCHSSRTLVRNEIPGIPAGQLVTTEKTTRQFSVASLAANLLVCFFFFNCPSFYVTVNTLFFIWNLWWRIARQDYTEGMSLYNMHSTPSSLKNIERTLFTLRYDKLLNYLTRFLGCDKLSYNL